MTEREHELYCEILRLQFILANLDKLSPSVVESAIESAQILMEKHYEQFQEYCRSSIPRYRLT